MADNGSGIDQEDLETLGTGFTNLLSYGRAILRAHLQR